MQNGSASRPKHRHETSMDNFIKNIKKHNQRSERYMSPLLYMYSRNHTTNTIDKSRSRTLSNRKSSVGAVSKTKRKIEKILKTKRDTSLTERNPAYIIEDCGSKLKKIEKYLEKKNQIGHYLCQNFLKMLNEIVENMVVNLDTQLQSIEEKATRKVEVKYQQRLHKLEKQNQKLSRSLQQNLDKLNNNSSLLYHIRMLSQIDVDYLYGKCILGTEECGGRGYGKVHQDSFSNSSDFQRLNDRIQSSSGLSMHKKELLQFQEISEEYSSRKKRKIYKQTAINPKMEEGVGQKESGRIRPIQEWKKQIPSNLQQHLFYHDDQQPQQSYRPFGRRMT